MAKKAKSITKTKRIPRLPDGKRINPNIHPAAGTMGFRKKGSSFKSGVSHSTITQHELNEAYKGIDGPEEEV
jgi:hypothetical protein